MNAPHLNYLIINLSTSGPIGWHSGSRNLGTIIRAMVAFGITTLCVTDNCVDVFHPKAVNASSGALADIKIYNESHWADWLPSISHPVYVIGPC